MRKIVILALLVGLVGEASAEVVGPLLRAEADFPGYAVFQVNGKSVKRGQKVTVQRRGQLLVAGKVTEVAGGRCMVKFNQVMPLFRGDLLHTQVKADPRLGPSLGSSRKSKAVRRTRFTRRSAKRKLKAGRSPHVITPAELAAQSRSSSLYTMGGVSSSKTMASQSRRSSVWTTGRTLSVKEYAQQMNR